jgi:hypothetical protein
MRSRPMRGVAAALVVSVAVFPGVSITVVLSDTT